MKRIIYSILITGLFASCASVIVKTDGPVSLRSVPDEATVYEDSTELGTTRLSKRLDRSETHILKVEKEGYLPAYVPFYTNKANNSALLNALNLGWFYNYDIRQGGGARWADAAQEVELYKKPDSISNTQSVYFNKLEFDVPEEDSLLVMRLDGDLLNYFDYESDEDEEEDGEQEEEIEEYEGPMKWRNDDDDVFAARVNDALRECGYTVPEEDGESMFEVSNTDYFISAKVTGMYNDMDIHFSFSENYPIHIRLHLDVEWTLTNAFQDTIETYPVSIVREYWFTTKMLGVNEDINQNDYIDMAAYELIRQPSFYEHVSTELDRKNMVTRYEEPLVLQQKKQVDELSEALNSVVTIKTGDGHGSGCILSSDGYIATNYHVVHGADTLEVRMANDSTFPAELIRKSEVFDLAIVKIDCTGLPGFALDTTTEAGYGADVYSIGTGVDVSLGQSLSKGIISGKRQIGLSEYLQTDVTINPGSSGGALVSKEGELLGIVSAKMMGVGIEGIGFAIPVKTLVKGLKLSTNPVDQE
jgi:hypothetical protein